MNASMTESLKNLRLSYRLLLSLYAATLVFFLSPDLRLPLKEARAELALYRDAVSKIGTLRAQAAAPVGSSAPWLDLLTKSNLQVEGTKTWHSMDLREPKTVGQTVDFFTQDLTIFSYAPVLTATDLELIGTANGKLKAIPIGADLVGVLGDALPALEQVARAVVTAADAQMAAVKELQDVHALQSQLPLPLVLRDYSGPCEKLKGTAQESWVRACENSRALSGRLSKSTADEKHAGERARDAHDAWRNASTAIRKLLPSDPPSVLEHPPDRFLVTRDDLMVAVKSSQSSRPLSPRATLGISVTSDQIKALDEWEKLKDREIPPVIDYLDIRLQTQGRQGAVLGFAIPEGAFLTIVSIVLFVLLLYFRMNAAHVRRHWAPEMEPEIAQFPWLGFHPDRLSATLLSVSVLLAPIAISALAFLRLGRERVEYDTLTRVAALGNILVAVAAMQVSWCLWNRNSPSRALSEPGLLLTLYRNTGATFWAARASSTPVPPLSGPAPANAAAEPTPDSDQNGKLPERAP